MYDHASLLLVGIYAFWRVYSDDVSCHRCDVDVCGGTCHRYDVDVYGTCHPSFQWSLEHTVSYWPDTIWFRKSRGTATWRQLQLGVCACVKWTASRRQCGVWCCRCKLCTKRRVLVSNRDSTHAQERSSWKKAMSMRMQKKRNCCKPRGGCTCVLSCKCGKERATCGARCLPRTKLSSDFMLKYTCTSVRGHAHYISIRTYTV